MGKCVRLAVVLSFALAGAAPAAAQVGHDPRGTPYRDVAKGHTITAIGGYLSGDGGRFGIAPHNGPFGGIRYEIRNSSSIAMALQVIYGDFDRLIVDPFVARVNRVSGPVKQSVTFTEASIQFNLTGGKDLAPAGAVLQRDDRPQLSRQHAAGHQRLRAGTQGDPRARSGLPAVPDPGDSPPGRGPGWCSGS